MKHGNFGCKQPPVSCNQEGCLPILLEFGSFIGLLVWMSGCWSAATGLPQCRDSNVLALFGAGDEQGTNCSLFSAYETLIELVELQPIELVVFFTDGVIPQADPRFMP